jgi:D-3-phosphoglycerate dehydrogenase
MKVIIADPFESWGVEELRRSGCEVTHDPALKGEALRQALVQTGATVLVVRSSQVTAEMLEASPSLGLVVRAGAGVNTIDVGAASRRGILVSNCPGRNAVAVAELTFGLILALDRRIVDNACDLRAGKWNKKEYSRARGLKDRTLGIVGMGQIGRAVARRGRAFEMKVVAWSRSLGEEEAGELGVERLPGPAEVAARSDVFSIHLAATPETRGLIGAEVLERLRPGSLVINTARAEVMDYAALGRLVESRGLRVGLDVFANEPAAGQGPFCDGIVNAGGVVYGTHHIGASTDQAQDAIAAEAVRIVRAFAATGQAPNCVNLATRTAAKCQLVLRHYDKVGVLASVLDRLRRANINVEEMSNTVFQEAKAAVAVIRLGQSPGHEVMREIAAMEDMVIHVELKPV